MAGKRSFGELEARQSKTTHEVISWRARYIGPDGARDARVFGDRMAAESWLVDERRLIDRNEWLPPDRRDAVVERLTLSEWATECIEGRTLAPWTLRDYSRILRVHIEPTIGTRYLDEVTAADVAAWHARLKKELRARARKANRTTDGSGEAGQAYKCLSAVFKAAIARGLLDASPAHVVAGGRRTRQREPVLLSESEVQALAQALPEHLRALADLWSWTGLRIGEARALRRRDVDLRDLASASVSVAQNVSQGGKGVNAVVGRPVCARRLQSMSVGSIRSAAPMNAAITAHPTSAPVRAARTILDRSVAARRPTPSRTSASVAAPTIDAQGPSTATLTDAVMTPSAATTIRTAASRSGQMSRLISPWSLMRRGWHPALRGRPRPEGEIRCAH